MHSSIDCLLVNATYNRNKDIDAVIAKVPNIGILSLAATLACNEVTVELLDTDLRCMDKEEIIAYAAAMASPPRFVGVSSTTLAINQALEICEIFKARFPKTITIIGGPHATLLPDEVLACRDVDFVVRGEGEFTLLELVRSTEHLENITGLSFKRGDQIIHNPDRPLLNNLDSLPLPAYHLININEYRPSIGCYQRLPFMPVLTAKGCTGKCTFCATNLFGSRVRFKSPARVIEELSFLIDNYQIKEIVFYDDVFSASQKRTMEICDLIIANGLDLTWSCLCRADQTPRALLSRMKEAGCHTISYGVESGNAIILKTINKQIDLVKVEEAVANCKELGIGQRLAFMFGNPGETVETMEQTFQFAKKLDPTHAVFNITTPFPGSEMYTWAHRNGLLITKDYKRFNGMESLINLPTVTKEEVERYCYMARDFFLQRFLAKSKNEVTSD